MDHIAAAAFFSVAANNHTIRVSRERRPSSAKRMEPHNPQRAVPEGSNRSPLSPRPVHSARNYSNSERGSGPQQSRLSYADLRSYISQKRHHWLVTRDVELAYPLQQKYLAFEADVMGEIHEAECEEERNRQERKQTMSGSTGLVKFSWRLYELREKLCRNWRRQRLHGSWKSRHLNAMKKQLSDEYVKVQIVSRGKMTRDLISVANEQTVECVDDGAYEREGMLSYIVTGYDSIFPITRELEVEPSRY
ncbi:hypothetical protein diail_3402 [Diaporthe ilicicola]|nr:hypothetical protein diail_3402 [Diaporthe ilicicola]